MVKGSCGFGHWTLVVGEGLEREGEMPSPDKTGEKGWEVEEVKCILPIFGILFRAGPSCRQAWLKKPK
jgi:hypothetical protein